MVKIFGKSFGLILIILLMIAGFSSCDGKFTLKDFIDKVTPGYTPFEKLYVQDQIRVGSTKMNANDYDFNEYTLGTISCAPATTTDSIKFNLTSKNIAKFNAKVKGIISTGLNYDALDTLRIYAKGIKIFSFSSGYKIYLPKPNDELMKNGKILTNVIRIDTLKIQFVYKLSISSNVEVEQGIKTVENAGFVAERNKANAFTVTYVNRPIAYHDKKIDSDKVYVDTARIIVYGQVSCISEENGISVEITFSDGTSPIHTTLDPYGRYSIAVPIKTALDNIRVKKQDGTVLAQEPFDIRKTSYEYNFCVRE